MLIIGLVWLEVDREMMERGCVVLDQPQRCGTVLRLVEDDTAALRSRGKKSVDRQFHRLKRNAGLFNSAHPTGAVPQDGTIAIGDSKSIDLGALLKAGENNRIVVQHVDDCGGQSWLGSVDLEVKGDAGPGAQRPTWGRLKSMYR